MGRRGSPATRSRSRRTSIVGAVLAVCALVATSVSSATSSESGTHKKTLRVALILPDLNNPFHLRATRWRSAGGEEVRN